MNQQILQIIDGNLNRSREGLRVCEDISRFVIADRNISKSLKVIRHLTTKAILDSKIVSLRNILKTRDTQKDVLKFTDFKKSKDTDITDIFMSNIERVKESLRVIEECCKIIDEKTSFKYRTLRFYAYDIEKKAVEKIRSLSNRR